MDKRDYYGMVREFHEAFGHPAPAEPTLFERKEPVNRAGFIVDEVFEFVRADSLVAQMDALADIAYFAIGTAVGVGAGPDRGYSQPGPDERPQPMISALSLYSRIWYGQRMMNNATNLMMMVDPENVCHPVANILNICTDAALAAGLYLEPFFYIVHDANMKKLWPDGRPRHREGDGKVIKPPDWQGPEEAIAAEIERQAKEMGVEVMRYG